jgi:ribosomal protein L32
MGETGKETGTVLPTVSGAQTGLVGRVCVICGASIAAHRAGTKFCGSACRSRAYDQRSGRRPAAGPRAQRYSAALTHPTYSVESCPKCGFPEADGGACANCGWTLPRPGTQGGWTLHPAGTVHGRPSR